MKNSELAKAWSSLNALEYYQNHRNAIEDMYLSEKKFLPDFLAGRSTLLDVGCAAGGFSRVAELYNPDIDYTGVDISPAMIEKAKEKNPDGKYFVCDGEKLDFAVDSFDAVISFGVLHMTENWKVLLKEAWRVCQKKLLFDVRLVDGKTIYNGEQSYHRIDFGGAWDGVSKVPYLAVNIDEMADYLGTLEPKVKSLRAYGYWHQVSAMTVSAYKTVCMTMFLLDKNPETKNCDFIWETPLQPRKK